MNVAFRADLPQGIQTVVVKLGTQAVTLNEGGVNPDAIREILKGVLWLKRNNISVIIVSSGAVHSGRALLPKISDRSIDALQALSAAGQPRLHSTYQEELAAHGFCAAQVLLTHEDFVNRTRYLNVRQTLSRLLSAGAVPVLNENDTVSFEEIELGDNDRLAALVGEMMSVDLAVFLTGSDGLFQQDPARMPLGDSPKAIPVVSARETLHVSLIGKSSSGTGGMTTKVEAARRLTAAGIPVVLATCRQADPLTRCLSQSVGTLFTADSVTAQSARRRWLRSIVRPGLVLEVNEGACTAIRQRGSLLPVGIIAVRGEFRRGDCVSVRSGGLDVACGLVEYESREMRIIQGKRSSEIQDALGHYLSDVAIHRDHLCVF